MSYQGKTVVLGVTGSIAAYKAADLISRLRKHGIEVYVVMTKSATEFVTPMTFESLSGHPVASDLFRRDTPWEVEHIALAKRADVFVVAPATANILAKMATGIADDMLSTTLLATKAPVLVAPAMNTAMYQHPATQANLQTLQTRGVQVVAPSSGRLACGDMGEGKLADVEMIERTILHQLTVQDCKDIPILITAGPTREDIDPVRFLSNHSTGKMGYALAERAVARGAKVTLVTGPVALAPVQGAEMISVNSALEMHNVVLTQADAQGIIIKAAAVGDYRPVQMANEKIKKQEDEMTLTLCRNPDILAQLGKRKSTTQVLCGFSMETTNLLENSQKKLQKKGCDLLVANHLRTAGAGFACDTNVVTFLYPDGRIEPLEQMTKREVADQILDRLLQLYKGKQV